MYCGLHGSAVPNTVTVTVLQSGRVWSGKSDGMTPHGVNVGLW
jgi:hypothetical protein